MARLPEYVTRIGTVDGSVRYEARINVPLPRTAHPVTQALRHRRRFATVAEATAWHARTAAELGDAVELDSRGVVQGVLKQSRRAAWCTAGRGKDGGAPARAQRQFVATYDCL
jgi:hypothetical protein